MEIYHWQRSDHELIQALLHGGMQEEKGMISLKRPEYMYKKSHSP